MNNRSKQGYGKYYSQDGFWKKLLNFARTAGREVVENALSLYYTAQAPDTPSLGQDGHLRGTGVLHSSGRCNSRPDPSRRLQR